MSRTWCTLLALATSIGCTIGGKLLRSFQTGDGAIQKREVRSRVPHQTVATLPRFSFLVPDLSDKLSQALAVACLVKVPLAKLLDWAL